jgi:hypothetical protein
MPTQLRWCSSVALSGDAQLVVSNTDAILRSLVRRVPLAEREPKRRLGLSGYTSGPVAHWSKVRSVHPSGACR